MQYIVWTVQCTVCRVKCTVYNEYSKMCSRGPDMSSIEAQWAEQENCVNHEYLQIDKKINTFKLLLYYSCIARITK